MNESKQMTMLQWLKEGYILNSDAVGNEQWTNCNHVRKAVYYKETEVHKDKDTARNLLKERQKQTYQRANAKAIRLKKSLELRELMKTKWQWLQEGRIPNPSARWRCGEDLNRIHKLYYSYGSSYYYCHIDDTHLPVDSEELQKAIEEYHDSFF